MIIFGIYLNFSNSPENHFSIEMRSAMIQETGVADVGSGHKAREFDFAIHTPFGFNITFNI